MRGRSFLRHTRAWHDLALAFLASAAVLALVMFAVPSTGAVFTADYPAEVTIDSGQIFPADRLSPAFKVGDHSTGSGVDVSSPIAFAGDGLSFTTSGWPVAFAGDRYDELVFNSPLPGNVALTSASLDLSWASVSGTACMYFEVKDSSGAPVDAEGSSGSPLACTSSSALSNVVTPIPPMTLTDTANGARVRMYVSSSAGAGTVIDKAVLNVVYNGQQFTLYATDLTDLSDGTPWIEHWGLAGP